MQPILFFFFSSLLTRAVRGSDYSPTVELSEEKDKKDKLVTENWILIRNEMLTSIKDPNYRPCTDGSTEPWKDRTNPV